MESASARESAIRVAIVDDHALVLEGITARLATQAGIRVVASEPTWVGLLSHSEFPVDVVVLDLHLQDQISIGTKLKTLTAAGSRAIVMSRHADAASILSAIGYGAKGFIPKSESADELVKAIECAADGRQYENRPTAEAFAVADRGSMPQLGNQERRALMLYAAGRPVKEVAVAMGTTEDTVKSYIKRGRRKYRAAGIDIGTRVLLRRQATVEGWLSPE
ncbi:MAG TPA: response regulator transcription factor [Homoserinimonas sp.]|nr:response regulator transcription factor [Homoserinimonas sp.]